MINKKLFFISALRTVILCLALVFYGVPSMAMTPHDMISSDTISPEISSQLHCDNMDMNKGETSYSTLATNSSSKSSCCDKGTCTTACMGLSVAIIASVVSTIKNPLVQLHGEFITHFTEIDQIHNTPPPQI
ncbi:MAG: hypothetical protein K9G26_05205 [Emcibacter sp.]|nr:hypothetical protein [Emcibacter sp.]